MKISVDMTKCQDHGQCVIAAPDVFVFDQDGKLTWTIEPDEAEREAVEDAADVCPMQAILLEG
ncbi:ferredoxin [Amycolatopsis sp. H6(2020)]|nr:ferredoxin [Amycolatopsis sp. H6(2020)]